MIFLTIYLTIIFLCWTVPVLIEGVAEGKGKPFNYEHRMFVEQLMIWSCFWPLLVFFIPFLPFAAVYYIIFYTGKCIGKLLK